MHPDIIKVLFTPSVNEPKIVKWGHKINYLDINDQMWDTISWSDIEYPIIETTFGVEKFMVLNGDKILK